MDGLEKIVGANVRRLRKERRLTQEQLAFELELTTRYVGMIERGETSVTLRVLGKLAGVLAVSPAALLDAGIGGGN